MAAPVPEVFEHVGPWTEEEFPARPRRDALIGQNPSMRSRESAHHRQGGR